MKKFLTIISLAVLTIGLLDSCNKEDPQSDKIIEKVGDAIPDNFPTAKADGWINENGEGGADDCFCFKKADQSILMFIPETVPPGGWGVSLSQTLTKDEDGRSYSCTWNGAKITFNMTTDGNLESITLVGDSTVPAVFNGTYKPRT